MQNLALIFSSQSINQSINLYRAIIHRRVLQCGYDESKRNVLRPIVNLLTDGTVRQFSGREFQSSKQAGMLLLNSLQVCILTGNVSVI